MLTIIFVVVGWKEPQVGAVTGKYNLKTAEGNGKLISLHYILWIENYSIAIVKTIWMLLPGIISNLSHIPLPNKTLEWIIY